MTKYTHVIWDWNGTLLDDVEWCMSRVNFMLAKRGLSTLDSVESYHKVFGFPVRDYYERVGFDFEKEPFEMLAAEYIKLYHDSEGSVVLFPEAVDILSTFRSEGICQVVLSASEKGNLRSQMKPFSIDTYFDRVLGVSDIFATGKIEIGKEYISQIHPRMAIMIGDTVHDKEVADALGIDCILVANGHQSKNTLLTCGTVVMDCLADAKDFILGQ